MRRLQPLIDQGECSVARFAFQQAPQRINSIFPEYGEHARLLICVERAVRAHSRRNGPERSVARNLRARFAVRGNVELFKDLIVEITDPPLVVIAGTDASQYRFEPYRRTRTQNQGRVR